MPGASYDPTEEQNKKLFKGKRFVLEGHFKDSKGEFMEHTHIAGLIRLYGGDVDQNVNPRTNYLVTTIPAVKTHGRKVQRAVAMGRGKCTIVAFDFITDSIVDLRNGRPRHQSKTYHSMEKVLYRLKDYTAAKQIYKNSYYTQRKNLNRLIDSRAYHPYKDATGFTYKVALTREFVKLDKRGRPEVDAVKSKKKLVEKWTLMLFESNGLPCTYKLGINYNKPGQRTITIHEYLNDGDFAAKFKEFKKFFQDKTGIAWDKRLDGLEPPRTIEKANKKGLSKEDGETEAEDKRPFIYAPPPRDQPRGEMPTGWKDPVQALIEKEERLKQVRLAKEAVRRAKEAEDEAKELREMMERDKLARIMMKEDEVVSEGERSRGGWEPVDSDTEDDDE